MLLPVFEQGLESWRLYEIFRVEALNKTESKGGKGTGCITWGDRESDHHELLNTER